MGWTLSKPYALAVFDAQVQQKTAFQEWAALCQMFVEESEHHKVLVQHIGDPHERNMFLRGKILSIILDMIERSNCDFKSLAKQLGPLIDAWLGAGTALGDVGDLRLFGSIACCNQVEVTTLKTALGEVGDLKESGDLEQAGVFTKLFGAGGQGEKLLEYAHAVLEERNHELAREVIMQKFRKTFKSLNVAKQANMDAKQLNDVQEFFDACDAATKNQRKAVSLTKAFRQELGEMQKVIIGSYSAAVMALMRDQVVAALHFGGQALSLDGFTTALSTEPSERPQVRVPVSIDSFEQMES